MSRYSLDLSKNNLTGPGKSPINTQKDFSSAIQVVGQDNERYGAWNDGSSDEDENSDNDEEENNDDDEGSEDNVETGDADMMREAKLAKFRKKTPKPPPKDTLEGVDVNHYGIYLILKHLVSSLLCTQRDVAGRCCEMALSPLHVGVIKIPKKTGGQQISSTAAAWTERHRE